MTIDIKKHTDADGNIDLSGNLIAEDPRQKKLELQQAPQEPVRTLRTVKSA